MVTATMAIAKTKILHMDILSYVLPSMHDDPD